MKISGISLTNFKRFSQLQISDIPESAHAVILTGPNGSGKSTILEALHKYRRTFSGWAAHKEPDYFSKYGETGIPSSSERVNVTFHGVVPTSQPDKRRSLWVRSAYRHSGDVTGQGISRVQPLTDEVGSNTLLQIDSSVQTNYNRLVGISFAKVFSAESESSTCLEVREELIAKVRNSFNKVFPDLELGSLGNPLSGGSFEFSKGKSRSFPFKNLSAGERAVFDLLLDIHVRSEEFADTVFAIDEPELHIGVRAQAKLMECLLDCIPKSCQLWINTHSLGMARAAVEHGRATPGSVAFIDLTDVDPDQVTVIKPSQPNRATWSKLLQIALDDLADLVAPRRIFICEGGDPIDGFDARVFRQVFGAQDPELDFISAGSSNEVIHDKRKLSGSISVLSPGTHVTKIVDGDDLADNEKEKLISNGIRVLRRRNLECFILADEPLKAFCDSVGATDRTQELLAARDDAIQESHRLQGTSLDDRKKAAGAVKVFAEKELQVRGQGSNAHEFMLKAIVPFIRPGTSIYDELQGDIFGANA